MHLRVFLVANDFQFKIKKNEGHVIPENMRATPTKYLVLPSDGTHSEGDTDIAHLTLGFVRYKSPSVGKIGEHLATGSIPTKDGVGSVLPKKRKKRERMEDEKKEKREKERELKKKKKKKRARVSQHAPQGLKAAFMSVPPSYDIAP
jgi:hypothetical protein